LYGYRSYRLKLIDIELSNKCNLRCKMCWFHGEQGIGDRYIGCELATREVLALVEEVSCHRPAIYIGGTEPFIRRDILTILEHIKKKNMRVSFTTNGTLLGPAKIEKLVRMGVDDISFSIDGHRQLHDSLRGPGVFYKVTSAIAQLAAVKKKMACTKPTVHVNIVMNSAIIPHLEETLDAIEKATIGGVDFYRLHHLWFVTQAELALHQQGVRRALGCMAPGARSHLISDSQRISAVDIAGKVSRLLNHPKIISFPDLSQPGLRRYYGEGPSEKKRCVAPFYAAVVKPNGDVKFCPDEWVDDYCLGNIRMDSFNTIWNNSKSRRFRKALWMQKQFTGCKRCSWIYSF
jgi:radical SAM protein with 4Fe4S-binding SPASM domain